MGILAILPGNFSDDPEIDHIVNIRGQFSNVIKDLISASNKLTSSLWIDITKLLSRYVDILKLEAEVNNTNKCFDIAHDIGSSSLLKPVIQMTNRLTLNAFNNGYEVVEVPLEQAASLVSVQFNNFINNVTIAPVEINSIQIHLPYMVKDHSYKVYITLNSHLLRQN